MQLAVFEKTHKVPGINEWLINDSPRIAGRKRPMEEVSENLVKSCVAGISKRRDFHLFAPIACPDRITCRE
jgi:hypothetical protein